MTEPVYLLWLERYKEAWYALSDAEQIDWFLRIEQFRKDHSGQKLPDGTPRDPREIACEVRLGGGQWTNFGIEEFPDLDAAAAYMAKLQSAEWFRYVDYTMILGEKLEEPGSSPLPGETAHR